MSEVDIGYDGEIIPKEEKVFDFGKLFVLAVFSVYFLSILSNYSGWCFIDGMNIWVHEAGHFLFAFFGSRFLTIAGGTIMQLLMPALFVAYFYLSGQRFSAALTTFWLGENFFNISIYMTDAVVLELPLLGGGGSESHDWLNMFSMLGILDRTETIAAATRLLGVAIILFAIGWGTMLSCKSKTGV